MRQFDENSIDSYMRRILQNGHEDYEEIKLKLSFMDALELNKREELKY